MLDDDTPCRHGAQDLPGAEPEAPDALVQALRTAAPLSRRGALLGGGAAALLARHGTADAAEPAPPSLKQPAPLAPNTGHVIPLRIAVNGETVALEADTRTSLLDLLRERLGLTGAKKGCDHGQCGACTVHVEGKRVASCLTMAAKSDGRRVTTIEGISPPDGALHPMQQAFIDHDALQCGYCTPGQIMAAIACVHEGHATSREQIREFMSGNICRCGAYVGIVTAIEAAAPQMLAGSRA